MPPKGYDVPYDDYGSIGEQILGRGHDTRSTKTFIENGPLAMFLGMFEALPELIINTGRRFYADEFDVDINAVTLEMIFEAYPEARELLSIHGKIINHKGSQQGYLVDRFTGWASDEEMREQKKDKKTSLENDTGGKDYK